MTVHIHITDSKGNQYRLLKEGEVIQKDDILLNGFSGRASKPYRVGVKKQTGFGPYARKINPQTKL